MRKTLDETIIPLRDKTYVTGVVLAACAALFSPIARAQETTAAPDAQTQSEQQEATVAEHRQQEIAELKARLGEAEERIDTLELENLQNSALDLEDTSLNLHGFFDMTFTKTIVGDDSIVNGIINENAYFMVQHFNLYFFKELSESFSFLSELRFTFLPLGNEYSFELPGFTEYDRADEPVVDPQTSEHLLLNGIFIERIHLTWKPSDHFRILAGRFLTPFGIWNVDHGSPVLITVRYPFSQLHRIVPLAQTGIKVFGRFYPTEAFFIDYAVTVSNGRGPIEAVQDLDENKAVGLRLRLTYEDTAVRIALGGYGYRGDYTDIKKTMTLNPSFKVIPETIAQSSEWAVAADFLFEFHDFRIQSEFTRRHVVHEIHGEREPILGVGLQPNFNATDAYALAAYTLPLHKWVAPWSIMPYFMYEYVELDDSSPNSKGHVWVGGLNLRPKSFLVLKAEYSFADLTTASMHVFSAQMAVSF